MARIFFGSLDVTHPKIQTSSIPVTSFCLEFPYWSKTEIPQTSQRKWAPLGKKM